MKRRLSIVTFLGLVLLLVGCATSNEVELVLPQSMFSEEEVQDLLTEIDGEESEVRVNDEGDFVYVIDQEAYEAFMNEIGDSIDEMAELIVTSGDYPSIYDIEVEEDYSTYTLVVDQAQFNEGLDGMVVFTLAISGLYYQIFDVDNDYETVLVNYQDEATGEIFDSVTYPDDLEG